MQPNEFTETKLSFAGGTSGSIQHWQLDELFGLPELNQNYNYMDNNASSKADGGKFGDSDSSPILRSVELGFDSEECLGQVPDASWSVPQMNSPPTASGLYWPKSYELLIENAAFVPDISFPNYQSQSSGVNSTVKRRRH